MIVYLQMLETAEDRAAFEQLYLTYRSLMYRIAYGILRNQQDAEDAVHQAFLSMIGGFKKINKIECPKTKAFCVIVVERKSLDLLRIRKRDIDSCDVERHGVEIPLPGDNGLTDALARLSARYREVLLLRYYFGYATREIADMLQMSLSATNKLLWRAKAALAAELEGGGDPDAEV